MQQAKVMERTGIVDEGLRRAAVYGRFVDRRVQRYLSEGRIQQIIAKEVDERLEAKIKAIVQRRLDKVNFEAAKMDPRPKWEVGDILKVAAAVTGVHVLDFSSPRRSRSLSWPRHLAIWMVRELRKDLSYPVIGRIFGNRDHTSIMYAVEMVAARKHEDPFMGWMIDPRVTALMEAK